MKQIINYLFLLVVVSFTFHQSAISVQAQEPFFKSTIRTRYEVSEVENAPVSTTHQVTLRAQQSNIYPTNFTLEVDPSRVTDLKASIGEEILGIDGTKILLPVPDEYLVETTFDVQYKLSELVRSKGKLKIISIPLFHSSETIGVDELEVELAVPPDWADVSITTLPYYQYERQEEETIIRFNIRPEEVHLIEDLKELQVVFGTKQLYDVALVYQLENIDLTRNIIHTIAFPPIFHGLQEVYVDQIVPNPESIEIDTDGNILGTYTLPPQSTLEVVFRGQLQIYNEDGSFEELNTPDLEVDQRYLIPDQYWDVNSELIRNLAAELQTPEAIYKYVTETLTYDEEKVKNLDIERIGALGALEQPENCACMEFTDLTVALMRAAGIPAREVDGYAYLEDDEVVVRPRVTDVLHAWVQYWEEDVGWINIDPTWGASTGRDYFNQFDHDHLIFVMKGVSSTYPYPAGAYRLDDLNTQNVIVELAADATPSFQTFDQWFQTYNAEKPGFFARIWEWILSLFS